MRVIGLTGGIASGKSTVAKFLEKLGAVVIDADQLAREAVLPGEPAYNAIIQEFGSRILKPDLTIDRGALGKIVFADPDARRRLEKITHPAIGNLAETRLAEVKKMGAPLVFYMAPLLIEAGVTDRVDEIWVVYVSRETQVKRLMLRDRITHQEAVLRIESQMPMEEKRKHGKAVIDNSGTQEETEQQVQKLWKKEMEEEPERGAD